MDGVLIRGDGIAAACCAHLLRSAGFRVAVERLGRPKVPALLLSDSAMALIGDVLGNSDVFAGLPRIERRVVKWGPNTDPVAVPHSAAVISEESLLDRIQAGLGSPAESESAESCGRGSLSVPLERLCAAATGELMRASVGTANLKGSSGRGCLWRPLPRLEELTESWDSASCPYE